MKSKIKIIMVIIGTLIGAGFASGREIYLFFTRYGLWGIMGMTLSSFLTGIIVYKTLNNVKKYEIKDYNNLLEKINYKHKKINMLISFIVNIFLLISFYIMTAAFGAYINQAYRISNIIASIFFVIICYFIFLKNLKGVIKVNEILVPILIIFICYLGIKNIPYLLETNGVIHLYTLDKEWFISSIFYSSYNSIILIPVLCTMRNCINNKKDIIMISILSSFLILLLAFIIFGLLLRGQFYVGELELPLIQVSLEFGKISKYLYSFIIVISIFTSAISTGYSFLKNISKNNKMYHKAIILMCISSVIVSTVGFSKLVEILYPFFGILGLIQIMII